MIFLIYLKKLIVEQYLRYIALNRGTGEGLTPEQVEKLEKIDDISSEFVQYNELKVIMVKAIALRNKGYFLYKNSKQGDIILDIMIVTELISTMGFPVLACIGLGMYISTRDKAMREDNEKDKERLYSEIIFNREVNNNLLETNKLLAKDIKLDLEIIRKHMEKMDNK